MHQGMLHLRSAPMMSGDLMMAHSAKWARCSVKVSPDPPGLPTCSHPAGHTCARCFRCMLHHCLIHQCERQHERSAKDADSALTRPRSWVCAC